MKFSTTTPVKIVMLGAGGTGAHTAPHLYRLLYSLDRPVKFLIADGDIVESNNLVRQNFSQADLGQNKAQVLAERYSSVFGLETSYLPEYVENEDRLKELISPQHFYSGSHYDDSLKQYVPKHYDELVILIGATDNNKSRKMCCNVFNQTNSLIYLDSGNGEHGGQVVCGIRRGGKTIYKAVNGYYPEVMQDTDKFPTELSCAEASVSAPQSIVANLIAATTVINFVYNILVLGDCTTRKTVFSSKSICIQPMVQKRKKAA